MQVEVKLDGCCKEPRVIVLTDKMTEEIEELIRRITQPPPQVLVGYREGCAVLLRPEKITRLYAQGGKIHADTQDGTYLLRLRLYELEERLEKARFVRISNAEIVNLNEVAGFDLNLSGTICVRLFNGTTTYASRRYVAKIRKTLGI